MRTLAFLKSKLLLIFLSLGIAGGGVIYASLAQANYVTGMANATVRSISIQASRILKKSWSSIEMILISEQALERFTALSEANGVTNPGVHQPVTAVVNQFRPIAVDRPSYVSSFANLPYTDTVAAKPNRNDIDRNAYFQWQQITMNANSGAECMDGSDYKMFVNLTPASNNFVIFMESGGACVDFESCTGQIPQVVSDGLGGDGVLPKIDTVFGRGYYYDPSLGRYTYESSRVTRSIRHTKPTASNPNGIADGYMFGSTSNLLSNTIGTAVAVHSKNAAVVEAPMLSRFSLAEKTKFKMQDWNIIYMPYCTADTHIGDQRKLYQSKVNPSDSKFVRHAGIRNMVASLSVLRNQLPRPAQVLLYGQSAGAVGTDFVRPLVRTALDPSNRFFALSDSAAVPSESGDFFMRASAATKVAYPAIDFLAGMKSRWWGYTSLDSQNWVANPQTTSNGRTPFTLMQAIVPNLNINNLHGYGAAVANRFPNDRMLYVMSKSDTVIPSYIYEHNKGRAAAALADGDINDIKPVAFMTHLGAYHRDSWGREIAYLKSKVDAINSNTGYFITSGRPTFGSHVLTGLNYDGSLNYDTKTEVSAAIVSLMSGNGNASVIRESESSATRGLYDDPRSNRATDRYAQDNRTYVYNFSSLLASRWDLDVGTSRYGLVTKALLLAYPSARTPYCKNDSCIGAPAMGDIPGSGTGSSGVRRGGPGHS